MSAQSPSPSVPSLTASGVFRLQFTVPPSIHCLVNYATLSRIRTHRIRQTEYSVSSSFSFALSLSSSHSFAFTGGHIRYLIYPSPAQCWGETLLHHCGFSHVNPFEQQRLDSCCWCPCRVLDYFASYFFKLSPTSLWIKVPTLPKKTPKHPIPHHNPSLPAPTEKKCGQRSIAALP